MTTPSLRLGARGSLLSRMQSQRVADALGALHPGLRIELVIISTSGDRFADRPLADLGGKGLFTKELELALLAREVDFVVHSFKDVPITMPLVDIADLIIAATPLREDPRDVLVSNSANTISGLPLNARVGTSSLRRQVQLLALRPDLTILPIRGNIDTRLRKLRERQFDAIILAMAGLVRADLFDPAMMSVIPLDEILPAAGQAALALQCRRDRGDIQQILQTLNHVPTHTAVQLEREVVRRLEGDCHSPIAALATFAAETVNLSAAVGGKDGRPPVFRAEVSVPVGDAGVTPERVVEELKRQGASRH